MSSSTFTTVDPSTGEQIETFSFFSAAEAERTVALADKDFRSFRKSSVYHRARLLSELARSLRKNQARLAKIMKANSNAFSIRAGISSRVRAAPPRAAVPSSS